MLKNLCLSSLMLLLGSTAFAQQQTVTTNYTSPVTIVTANGCTITGITTLTYDGVSSLTTNGTGQNCSGGGNTNVASVTLQISPTTYTLGSGAAAPVVTVTNNTTAATVSCSLSPTNGFTVTSANPITGSGTFTLSTPTTAGTYTFTPVCTTSTAGYTSVAVSPQSVQLIVSPTPPPPSGCSASQTATVGTKTLQRQCTGEVNVWPGPVTSYNGQLTDLGTVLGGKSFPAYAYAGYSPTFTIQTGYYVALQFSAAVAGVIQFSANPSYGDGGIISLSTQPGSLLQGSPGVICSYTRGGINSLQASTVAGSVCQVQQGVTYYVNFADVDTTGSNLCFNGKPNTCGISYVAYTLYTSK